LEKQDGAGAGRGRGAGPRALALCVVLAAVDPAAQAATYLPMPDPQLAAQAPVVVHVRAGESFPRLEGPGPGPRIVTVTDLDVLEVLKGKVPASPVRFVVPGGRVGDLTLWVPGRPAFLPGQEAIVFVAPLPGSPGEYGPTEFALSVFDVLEDPGGTRFAVRTMFQAGTEEVLDPGGEGLAEPDHFRPMDPFLRALRAAGRGEAMPVIPRTSPSGPLAMPAGSPGGVRPLWVNIGGPEGGNLFRWNWGGTSGCPASANGVVFPSGTQTNLSDGTNGHSHVQAAVTRWTGVPDTDVRYSYSASNGNVQVNLDVESVAGAWSTPRGCESGAVGVGTPGLSYGPCSFKGDSGYLSPVSGSGGGATVWMRKSICPSGYSAAVFRTAVLHEVGHTLGLGHPDEPGNVSRHSTTTSDDWNAAVMRSVLPASYPDALQADDVEAVRFYYGTAASQAPPVASFTLAPTNPVAGQEVAFTDTSTNSPTRWDWNFGDGGTSSERNPVHAWATSGRFTVVLVASNASGSSEPRTRAVTVASSTSPVVAAFTFSPASPAPGQQVAFLDQSTGGPTSWAWSFGDPASGAANTSTLRNPAHAFAAAGTYTVTLTAANAFGGSTTTRQVAVGASASEAERVVPIVLDAFGVGGSRFRSELVLANRGTAASTVELTYTAATALNGTGSGTVSEALGAGRQLVVDDALAYLRSKGLAIPQAAAGASQGGTVRVRFLGLSSPEAGAAFARTTALLPEGRAGVAYPAVTPGEWLTPEGQHVFGLRETAEARSNLALVNLSSTADVGLRVTLQSGAAGDRRTFVLPETIWLAPLQWTQLGSVLARAGFTNGWALVERASGSGPFYAYGVFNDFGTNDGSFIDPIPVASGVPARTVPVILELGIYSTQLILTNPTASTVAVELGYVESLSAAGVARRTGTDLLQPREQKMVEAIPHLRALGVDVGAPGGSYAGSVVASFFQSGVPVNGFAGARTKSPGQPQGSYGVYYSGLGAGQMAPSEAWVYGLKQDGDSRTNVAVAHGEPGGGPIVVQAEVFDGQTGAKAGGTGNVTLKAGQWFQWNQILGSFGIRQGYARVFRVSGTSPFLAYGVVNDGGTARPGTNDGSYVPMLPSR
jgi:PKD repeat protein